MFHKSIYIIFLLFLASRLFSQSDSADQQFSQYVTLDSFVVVAQASGFDTEDFINMVMNDESFYKAFRNLRFNGYNFTNDLKLFNKKEKIKAFYESDAVQNWDGQYRSMSESNKNVSPNFYKRNGDYRFYTADLYDRLFFTHGRKKEKKIYTDPGYKGDSKMGKHIYELKKLIFSPGSKSDVPFLGKKTEIFSDRMMKYYNYSIAAKKFHNGDDCYVFIAELKPMYKSSKKSKTVIEYLATYFKKDNLQVLGRVYRLQYQTAAYRFDVSMDIQLDKINDLYFPTEISYNGFWKIPMKKAEIATFTTTFSNFYAK